MRLSNVAFVLIIVLVAGCGGKHAMSQEFPGQDIRSASIYFIDGSTRIDIQSEELEKLKRIDVNDDGLTKLFSSAKFTPLKKDQQTLGKSDYRLIVLHGVDSNIRLRPMNAGAFFTVVDKNQPRGWYKFENEDAQSEWSRLFYPRQNS